MSATATAPAAPAPAWLAAPAGDWKTLSAAMTAEVPADRRPPGPGRLRPRGRPGHAPPATCADIPVIEVDGDLLGVDPGHRDPAIPADRERYPVIWGALIHECAHAAHTQVRLPPAERRRTGARPPASWKSPASRPARPPAAPPTAAGCAPPSPSSSSPTSPPPAPSPPAPARPAPPPPSCWPASDAGILEPAETAPVAAKVEAAIGTEAPRPAAGHLARVPRRSPTTTPRTLATPRPPLVPHPRPRPRRRPARPPRSSRSPPSSPRPSPRPSR